MAEWSRSYKLRGHRSWSRLIELSQRLLGTGCTDVTKRLVISALIGCNFNKRVPLGAIWVCQCLSREKTSWSASKITLPKIAQYIFIFGYDKAILILQTTNLISATNEGLNDTIRNTHDPKIQVTSFICSYNENKTLLYTTWGGKVAWLPAFPPLSRLTYHESGHCVLRP